MKTIKLIAIVLSFVAAGAMNAQDTKPAKDTKEYILNKDNTEIIWTGKKVTGEHTGHIELQSGLLVIEDNKIANAYFSVDMTSITCDDIEDEDNNAKLVNHLKSDDFFGVNNYRMSHLVIEESGVFSNNEAKVKAKLTIKGISQPIEFTVKKEDGAITAVLVVDRSKYDIRYKSGSFFDDLGDRMIYDDFTLEVKLSVK